MGEDASTGGGASPRRLDALRAIADAACRRLPTREALDVAIEAVHGSFDADSAAYFRIDRGRGLQVLEAHRGWLAEDGGPIDRELPSGGATTGTVARTGRPVLVRDVASEALPDPELRRLGFRSVMAAPVAAGDDVQGVVFVASRTPDVWHEGDLQVFASIGRQLGCAVEVARLLSALEGSLERHRALVETIPHPVYEARPDGTLLFLSAKIAELVGHPAADLLGDASRFESLVHPEDRERRRAFLAGLGRPDAKAVVEYRLLHANGRDIVWVSDHAGARAPVPGDPTPAGPVVTGALIDLRERKVLEAIARERSRLASLGELAAGIAHEINNPLSGVISYAQLARRFLPPGETKLAEPIDGIHAEAERILEITRTLVSSARRPADEKHRPLDPRELLKSALTFLKQSLKEDSIRLEVDVEEGVPPLRARGHELRQVVENLLTNARHALNARFARWSPDKVLTVRVRKVPSAHADGSPRVRIEVEDRGCGIAPENLPRVFDAFFTTRKDGTGLGLAITKNIVAAHEGTIAVESQVGKGTVFRVELPAWD